MPSKRESFRFYFTSRAEVLLDVIAMNEVQSSDPLAHCTAGYSANTAASTSPAVARSERRDSSHMCRSHMPDRCKAHGAARLPQVVRASGGGLAALPSAPTCRHNHMHVHAGQR